MLSMEKLLLFDSHTLDVTLSRLCHQLLEHHDNFAQTVLVGMQPRGIYFAQRLKTKLEGLLAKQLPLGYLDTTFYRDDFRRRENPIRPNQTKMPFIVENQNVILIDDVLFTGRTVRSALSALLEFGRPRKVELLVLVDRQFGRDLPIEPQYIGKTVNTVMSQRVLVEWTEQGVTEDKIWLVSNAPAQKP